MEVLSVKSSTNYQYCCAFLSAVRPRPNTTKDKLRSLKSRSGLQSVRVEQATSLFCPATCRTMFLPIWKREPSRQVANWNGQVARSTRDFITTAAIVYGRRLNRPATNHENLPFSQPAAQTQARRPEAPRHHRSNRAAHI